MGLGTGTSTPSFSMGLNAGTSAPSFSSSPIGLGGTTVRSATKAWTYTLADPTLKREELTWIYYPEKGVFHEPIWERKRKMDLSPNPRRPYIHPELGSSYTVGTGLTMGQPPNMEVKRLFAFEYNVGAGNEKLVGYGANPEWAHLHIAEGTELGTQWDELGETLRGRGPFAEEPLSEMTKIRHLQFPKSVAKVASSPAIPGALGLGLDVYSYYSAPDERARRRALWGSIGGWGGGVVGSIWGPAGSALGSWVGDAAAQGLSESLYPPELSVSGAYQRFEEERFLELGGSF
jgi:hypothetical protein